MPGFDLQKGLELSSTIIGSKRDVETATALIEITKREDEVTSSELDVLREVARDNGWSFEGFQFDGNDQTTYAYFER